MPTLKLRAFELLYFVPEFLFSLCDTGVSAERRYLLLPWLSVSFVTFMLGIILVLALMFSFANNISVIIFLASGVQIGIKVNNFLYTIIKLDVVILKPRWWRQWSTCGSRCIQPSIK